MIDMSVLNIFEEKILTHVWQITIFNKTTYLGIHFISFRKCMISFLEEKEITCILIFEIRWNE